MAKIISGNQKKSKKSNKIEKKKEGERKKRKNDNDFSLSLSLFLTNFEIIIQKNYAKFCGNVNKS